MKECKQCILTSEDDDNLSLDENGICNYCNDYRLRFNELGNENERISYINKKIEEVKSNGLNNKYDCVIGLSGGVDSSYMAYWLCERGLRPLVIHLDNGWNSELAVQNIQNICEKLGLDLHTYVIEWEEFKKLQLAYLKASVVDIEVLTDHAIKAITMKMARKYKIKYLFSGFNLATEAVMIKGWTFDKSDFVNIKDIVKINGGIKNFRSYPKITFFQKLFFMLTFKIESIHVLNYIDYNKDQVKKVLKDKLGWIDYGGKHHESLFTKFYQSYILPEKFKIDKRKVHLSNLICSNQITKNLATDLISLSLYNENELAIDKEYILKKLDLTKEEFAAIMKLKINNHNDFKTEQRYWEIYFKFVNLFKIKK
jgi:N-acetyl sugar amidotransferase